MALLSLSVWAKLMTLDKENTPNSALDQNDYVCLLFHKTKHTEILDVFHLASSYYLRDHSDTLTYDVAFATLDLEQHPEYHWQGLTDQERFSHKPSQEEMATISIEEYEERLQKWKDAGESEDDDRSVLPVFILLNARTYRHFSFELSGDERKEEAALRLSNNLAASMETKFKEMDCQTMYKLMDDTVISLVYFGSPESLSKDGDMAHLHKVSI